MIKDVKVLQPDRFEDFRGDIYTTWNDKTYPNLKWRLDKNMCGPSMILAEIGTHAYHLLLYVTGLEVNEVSAEVNSLSPELSVDDNAFLILRMQNKARASIWISSAATGGENGLKIRVYGTQGALEWFQDDPNNLKFSATL